LTRTVLLVAGGTGGHLFPALALGEVLGRRAWRVHYATDSRVGRFIEGVPKDRTHIVRSATPTGGTPAAIAGSLVSLAGGLRDARRLLKALKPEAVVGFGGYPTVPPVMAARLKGLPAIVHEQNAVLGRANRLLVRFGAHLATGFRNVEGAVSARAATHVGNPVRAVIRAAAAHSYVASERDQPFRLFVFGGSQGARVFSDLVPQAVELLPEPLLRRLRVWQQCRPEDLERTAALYRGLGMEADLKAFFSDMAERLKTAHLVVSRAGASTVTELAAIGRPSILVPYPHALDHDQAANAEALARAGGAWLFQEPELTPETLSRRLADLMQDPRALTRAAAAAKSVGELDAAERLADLVERLSRGKALPAGRVDMVKT
jgi:UDP-N-acetylglucosamine--N-acetylmuramyl-(pentapeptide) pyrophosphoryl-undecaprenol N-acetylglucosamine transferase